MLKKVFAAAVVYVCAWTICAFATVDPEFYLHDKIWLSDNDIIIVSGGHISLHHDGSWVYVKSLHTDDNGVYYRMGE